MDTTKTALGRFYHPLEQFLFSAQALSIIEKGECPPSLAGLFLVIIPQLETVCNIFS
jgi:hypothetical protein